MIDLTQLKALHEAATPGPWKACQIGDYTDFDGNSRVILGDDRRVAVVQARPGDFEASANADIIEFFRNHSAEIIRRLEAADRMAEALEKIVDKDTHLVWTGGAVKEPSHDEYGELAEIAMDALAAYRKEGAL